MVQVLPYNPSPLEQLTPYLSQISQQIGEAYTKRAENQKAQQNYSILNDPNSTPIQKAMAFSKLPADTKKSSSPVWASILGPQAQSEANQQELQRLGFGIPSPVNMEGKTTEAVSPPVSSKKNIQDATDEQLVTMSAIGGPAEKIAQGELKRRETQYKKDEALWNYKPTQDYIKDIEEQARAGMTAVEAADGFINLAQSGEISPSNLRNLAASKFGDSLPFLYTPATAQAKFLEKVQAAGLKDIFPRPTEKEFFFINGAQAQLGKSNAANISVAQLQKKFAEIPIRAADFTQEVIQEHGGVPPRDLTAKVRKKMENYKKNLIDDSASISFEYGDLAQRKEAAGFLHTKGKNLPLTNEKMKEIFNLAGKNADKALKIAIELGYAVGGE